MKVFMAKTRDHKRQHDKQRIKQLQTFKDCKKQQLNKLLQLWHTNMSIQFMDTTLTRINNIQKNQYQVYASTSVMLAAKAIELDFKIPFIPKLMQASDLDQSHQTLQKIENDYILLTSLLLEQSSFYQYDQSVVAASCVAFLRKINGVQPVWNQKLNVIHNNQVDMNQMYNCLNEIILKELKVIKMFDFNYKTHHLHNMQIEAEKRDIYTFSPGPCSLPLQVQNRCYDSLFTFQDTGISALEFSVDQFEYKEIHKKCKEELINLFDIPSTFEVLLMEGGAHLLNSSVPLNLLNDQNDTANYIVTGFWGARTYKEAQKFGKINLVHPILEKQNIIPKQQDWNVDENAKYFHYTDNETLSGLEFKKPPVFKNGQLLISDMTSSLGTKKIETDKYACIYAASQKNLGVSGSAIAFVRKNLLGKAQKYTPSYADWSNILSPDFYYHPATYLVYSTYTYVNYLNQAPGGIKYWEELSYKRSKIIWDIIDSSRGFFVPFCQNYDQRSRLNISFNCNNNDQLDNKFIQEAEQNGLIELRGHPATKGIRVSIYNGNQSEGIYKLRDFMNDFMEKNEIKINKLSKL
ncbi:phosphoserine aminotransferase, putative [Ichthyophthirius multifiliis]|uniref:phosphoserine transaminase n=1 Tax=Ichthyophthirius multifiliis TaxID=5932 RepID=G0QXS7_ICHMU|nr:phosphoserine aminotransferase, putative [Ichthyophthirius multifiliis]EGR29978.1 phosphoserine aminotransferase, putative [Ichthyophthirius multifiliis]|eukprot:XP_004031214.1 phosphoserine aminotransferase, putative [Ichthyophthirius multifiliis]